MYSFICFLVHYFWCEFNQNKDALLIKFSPHFQLEIRLAEKEEQMLEKDLIFEQVVRLSQRVQKKADSGKNDTLQLAKQVACDTVFLPNPFVCPFIIQQGKYDTTVPPNPFDPL